MKVKGPPNTDPDHCFFFFGRIFLL
jgi:hypothetical protein